MPADRYFGNNRDVETINKGGKTYWRILTERPGTEIKHICGEQELLLPTDEYLEPQLLSEGCTPRTNRYIVQRAQGYFPIGTSLVRIDGELELESEHPEHCNWGSREEKWLQGKKQTLLKAPGGWYFVTPYGHLYKWMESEENKKKRKAVGPLIAAVGKKVYADPSLLYEACKPAPKTP